MTAIGIQTPGDDPNSLPPGYSRYTDASGKTIIDTGRSSITGGFPGLIWDGGSSASSDSTSFFSSTLGSAVDDFATFGLVGKAGAAWGSVDGTNKSWATAVGLTVAAIGAGLAFAATDGEEAEVNAEITAARDLVRANAPAIRNLWGTAIPGAAARIANPASASEIFSMGLSREILEAYEKIAVHQIQNGLNSTGIHDLRLQIIRDALSKL